MLALREEVKALRERRPQPTAEPVSLEEQLSDKVSQLLRYLDNSSNLVPRLSSSNLMLFRWS